MQEMMHPSSKRPRASMAGAVAALTLLIGAQPAPASLVPAMDLAVLTENAGRVVVAEVLSVRSDWDKAHRWIYTTIELQVAEIWKGQMPSGGRLRVVQPGGSVGDIEMHVHGLRAFRTGDRAVLFLSQGEPAWTVGLGQGHRPLRWDSPRRQWMVDPGNRSAVWRPDAKDPAATVAPAVDDGVLPLEDLRRRVRALVRP